MKPIIHWGVRGHRWSIIGWTWGISAYIALNILVYSSIRDQAQDLNKVLTSLPPAAQALFGAQGGNFLSPVGYLSSKLYYLILPLLFTMLAVSLSVKLLGREEQDGTLELLLARPISRGKVLLAKLASAFAISLVVTLLTLAVTIICARAIDYDIETVRLAQAAAMTLLLSLVFGSVAWLALCVGRLGRHASAGA